MRQIIDQAYLVTLRVSKLLSETQRFSKRMHGYLCYPLLDSAVFPYTRSVAAPVQSL